MLRKNPGDITGPATERSASPSIPAVSAEPIPSGASPRGDDSRKASIALIDEFSLRRVNTLTLLRTHFREAVLQFASVADFLTHASTCAAAPSAVVMCVGAHSVTDAPLPEHLHLISRAVPALPVIVLSDHEEAEAVVAAFCEGVRGYIPTSLAPRLVICAIRIVLAGGTFFPADALVRARRRRLVTPAAAEVTRATIASDPDTAGLDDRRDASP